jgi:hypothetical protein
LIALTGKVPVHKGWQKSSLPTTTTIERWLKKGHNLGLRTGKASGVIVLDDDSPDGSAAAALDLPKTVTVTTGSGKRHYYFAMPEGLSLRNSVKTRIAGMDVRADGGQVVFVGSIHPDTKQPYCWAPGLSPREVDLAPLPPNVLELLRQRERTVPKFTLLRSNDGTDQRVSNYAQAAIDGEVVNVLSAVEGNRNDTLNKAAFALGQLVTGGSLDGEGVRAALRDAAHRVGLPDAEAAKTIESGLDAGMKEPREVPAPAAPPASAFVNPSNKPEVDNRASIYIYAGWIHRAADQAEDILKSQRPALFYQRGSWLVRVTMLPEAGVGRIIQRKPIIQEVSAAAIVDVLTRLVRFERFDQRTEQYFVVDCPERLAQTLLSRAGDWRLQTLVGVIDAPTLRHDGSVLCIPGYDASTGLLLIPGSTGFPAVPLWPTNEETRAALDTVLFLLKEFPFLEEVDRSVALAAILTALIRPSVRTSPLFAFRAAKMGSGKSLLADVVALIATGRPAAVMSQGADENEDKKRMLPILAEGDPVAVIDNIERPFGSAALCSILTQATWRDRVLGKSQTLSLPTTNTTWVATGNNIVFVGDITTRTLVCDLDPKCERPEERRFDLNLHHYIPEHRGELVAAGLTLLRAYHTAGRPMAELPTFGRFEEWSDWVRQALVWLGLPDPCATRRRIEETDPVRAELADLLVALHRVFGTEVFKVADVMRTLQRDEDLHAAINAAFAPSGQAEPTAQGLGYILQRANRRPEGGLRVVRGPSSGGTATWRVERV